MKSAWRFSGSWVIRGASQFRSTTWAIWRSNRVTPQQRRHTIANAWRSAKRRVISSISFTACLGWRLSWHTAMTCRGPPNCSSGRNTALECRRRMGEGRRSYLRAHRRCRPRRAERGRVQRRLVRGRADDIGRSNRVCVGGVIHYAACHSKTNSGKYLWIDVPTSTPR